MEMCAYRCDTCGKLHHPAYVVCQKCGGRSFTKVPLEGNGIVLTWTKVKSLPVGFTEPCRNFGIVRFENGVTVTGVIAFDDIKTGMGVRATTGVIRKNGDEEVTGFVFKKAD